jgi:hypothetical protein
MSQELLKKVIGNFESVIEHLGEMKPEEVKSFKFVYNGTPKIESMKASCGCTDVVLDDLEDGSQVIIGNYRAPNRQSMEGMYAQYIIDDNNIVWDIRGQWAIASDVRLGKVPVDKIKGRKAPLLTQSVSVSFDDGEPEETIDPTRVRRVNGNKVRTNVTIQAIGDLR